jgi:hypothetical protein
MGSGSRVTITQSRTMRNSAEQRPIKVHRTAWHNDRGPSVQMGEYRFPPLRHSDRRTEPRGEPPHSGGFGGLSYDGGDAEAHRPSCQPWSQKDETQRPAMARWRQQLGRIPSVAPTGGCRGVTAPHTARPLAIRVDFIAPCSLERRAAHGPLVAFA